MVSIWYKVLVQVTLLVLIEDLNMVSGMCSGDLHLDWKVSKDIFTLICKIEKLTHRIVIKDPDGATQGHCVPPYPNNHCSTRYKNNTLYLMYEPNIAMFEMRGKIDSSINGNWTCLHGIGLQMAQCAVKFPQFESSKTTTSTVTTTTSTITEMEQTQPNDADLIMVGIIIIICILILIVIFITYRLYRRGRMKDKKKISKIKAKHNRREKYDNFEMSIEDSYNVNEDDNFSLETHKLLQDEHIDTTEVKSHIVDLHTEITEVNRHSSDLHTDNKDMTELVQYTVPAHFQEHLKSRIDAWRKEDETFVVTAGSKHVLKCIEQNGCVTVIGNSGTGKTFTARHTALQMEKKGYLIIPVSEPKHFNFFEHDHKFLFVIDDICGKFTLNERYYDDWKRSLETIVSLLSDKCFKIIATCRLQVYQDVKFKYLSVFNLCTCNLSSPIFALTSDEIDGFKDSYLTNEDNELPEFNKDIDFYPLLFELYEKTKRKNIKTFFSDPFECYANELDALKDEGHGGKRKYCGLVLCVLFNNTLCEKDLLGQTSWRKVAIKNVLLQCGAENEHPKQICKEIEALQDSFVKKEDGVFKIIHNKLFDFLALYFGNKMTDIFLKHAHSDFICERFVWSGSHVEDEKADHILLNDETVYLYIDRMIDMWKEGEVEKVFLNTNLLTSDQFREKFYKYLNDKPKSDLEQLVLKQDNESLNTPLHCVSFSGDCRGVQWMVQFGSTSVSESGEKQPSTSMNQRNRKGETPLHTACYNNNLDVVKELLMSDQIDRDVCNNKGRSSLYLACQRGNADVVRLLLQHSANINNPDKVGWTPLHTACYNNNVQVVNVLLKSDKIKVDALNGDRRTSLYFACEKGNADVVGLLLEKSANINKPDKDGLTPLYIACYHNNVDVVKELLKSDQIDVDVCTYKGRTSLYIACQRKHAEIVRLLLQHSVNMNKPDNDGWTPLHLACYSNYIEVIKELLKSDLIDVDICDNVGKTSLHLACYKGNVDVVRLLLQQSVNINKPDKYGWTPLHMACYTNHKDVVTELFKKGQIDVDACENKGRTALFFACETGNANFVKLLLQQSPNLNKSDQYGRTPLHIACYKNHEDVVFELLKNSHIDVDVCESEGRTPLFFACRTRNANLVKLILQQSTNINKSDKFGFSPLHIACYYNHENVVFELLKGQIDVEACENNGRTPLFFACETGNVNLVKLILQQSTNINKSDKYGYTPLHNACSENHALVVKELLKHDQIDIDALDAAKRSSLYLACEKGNVVLVKLLLQYSANINKPDKYGYTPLHIACYNNHEDVVTELFKGGHIDADVCENEGRTALSIACETGNANLVKLLLQHSSNINQSDKFLWTPLHIACHNNHVNVVTELFKRDQIDVDVCEIDSRTALYFACETGNANLVKLLLKHSTNVNKSDKYGYTPLHKACSDNHVLVVKELLKHDQIDIDAFNTARRTSLYLACENGNVVLVRLLLQHSANINKPDKYGYNPLHKACSDNHVSVAKELLQNDQIDVDAFNTARRTSLYLASEGGHVDLVRLLLQHSANINKAAKDDWTPFHIACYNNHVETVNELLKNDLLDVNVCDKYGQTALFLAYGKGNDAVIRLLLKKQVIL